MTTEIMEYERWFRTRVQEALNDQRPAISNADMDCEFSAIHAELAADAAKLKIQRKSFESSVNSKFDTE